MGISHQVQEVLVDLEEEEALADLVEVDLAEVVPGGHGSLCSTKIIMCALARTRYLSFDLLKRKKQPKGCFSI